VITGYNSDVEHGGVVYHVQTEDKGLESPLILSLVYSGGAILASKRTRYEDLITKGFSEEALLERVRRQHRLICAAIHAGRVEELRRMGAREAEAIVPPGFPAGQIEQNDELAVDDSVTVADSGDDSATLEGTAPSPPRPLVSHSEAYSVHDPRRHSPLGEQRAEEAGLVVSLLDEQDFRAGDSPLLRLLVNHRSGDKEEPMSGVLVSVKVLGTTFRPLIYSVKTEHDGIATVTAPIPQFTSGRAAILIRVAAGDLVTEVRRVIHPLSTNE